eukprot:TRINITY_DN3071_c1_g1_i1.p1 TRINITY_DN3071_c1_g1~~TRINITY_DN3071_c1_g1_i1.p1  ORF type:complete len:623 (+),score=169.30 TRINITY_DN3071_c1_g1_i1:891-2759(+)
MRRFRRPIRNTNPEPEPEWNDGFNNNNESDDDFDALLGITNISDDSMDDNFSDVDSNFVIHSTSVIASPRSNYSNDSMEVVGDHSLDIPKERYHELTNDSRFDNVSSQQDLLPRNLTPLTSYEIADPFKVPPHADSSISQSPTQSPSGFRQQTDYQNANPQDDVKLMRMQMQMNNHYSMQNELKETMSTPTDETIQPTRQNIVQNTGYIPANTYVDAPNSGYFNIQQPKMANQEVNLMQPTQPLQPIHPLHTNQPIDQVYVPEQTTQSQTAQYLTQPMQQPQPLQPLQPQKAQISPEQIKKIDNDTLLIERINYLVNDIEKAIETSAENGLSQYQDDRVAWIEEKKIMLDKLIEEENVLLKQEENLKIEEAQINQLEKEIDLEKEELDKERSNLSQRKVTIDSDKENMLSTVNEINNQSSFVSVEWEKNSKHLQKLQAEFLKVQRIDHEIDQKRKDLKTRYQLFSEAQYEFENYKNSVLHPDLTLYSTLSTQKRQQKQTMLNEPYLKPDQNQISVNPNNQLKSRKKYWRADIEDVLSRAKSDSRRQLQKKNFSTSNLHDISALKMNSHVKLNSNNESVTSEENSLLDSFEEHQDSNIMFNSNRINLSQLTPMDVSNFSMKID